MWPSAIANVPFPVTNLAPIPGVFFRPPTGTYAGWVVPSNYDTSTRGPISQYPGMMQSNHKIGTKNDVPLNNFAPRIGFAWKPTDSNRFMIRGGGGFFYDRVPGNTLVHAVEQSPPYAPTLDQGASTNQFSSLAAPFQNVPLGTFPIRWVNPSASLPANQSWNITVQALSENYLTPLVYSWNLNFQYEFMPRWVLEVGYVGSHGIHLGQWNHVISGANLATAGEPSTAFTTNKVTNTSLRVPYSGLSPSGLQLGDTAGDYKFNSLQATLRKQLSRGLTFQAAYTFSRAFTTQNGPGTGPNLNNPLDLRQQYGLNDQYRPQRFVLNFRKASPAQRWAAGPSRALPPSKAVSG